MKCEKKEINNVKFLVCSDKKIINEDLEELRKYVEFRKNRAKRKVKPNENKK